MAQNPTFRWGKQSARPTLSVGTFRDPDPDGASHFCGNADGASAVEMRLQRGTCPPLKILLLSEGV